MIDTHKELQFSKSFKDVVKKGYHTKCFLSCHPYKLDGKYTNFDKVDDIEYLKILSPLSNHIKLASTSIEEFSLFGKILSSWYNKKYDIFIFRIINLDPGSNFTSKYIITTKLSEPENITIKFLEERKKISPKDPKLVWEKDLIEKGCILKFHGIFSSHEPEDDLFIGWCLVFCGSIHKYQCPHCGRKNF